MKQELEQFLRRLKGSGTSGEEGQALVEYAMLLLLVALACVASLILLGDATVGKLWGPIQNVLVPVLGM